MSASEVMTPAQRREFDGFLSKHYVRAIKARGEARAAQLAAAVEEELAQKYEENAAQWAEAVEIAKKEIAEAEQKANDRVREVFAEHGLHNTKRMPSFQARYRWWDRGETFDSDRRQELRKVATAQAKLIAKAATAKAEEIAADVGGRALTEQWSWDRALAELRELPTLDALMPPLDSKEVHRIAREEHKTDRYGFLRGGGWPELIPGENEDDEAEGVDDEE